MIVRHLTPGDTFIDNFDNTKWTHVSQSQHPLWPSLRLVIWKSDKGEWSHDALLADQDIHGDILAMSDDDRLSALRLALLGGQK